MKEYRIGSKCKIHLFLGITEKFEKPPKFVTTGGSIGYVLECKNSREYFEKGDTLDFYLLLFGKTIAYFNQFVQAFQEMGRQSGIGKHHAKFWVSGIRNMEGAGA